MKKMIRLSAILALVLGSLSCSKLGLMFGETEFEYDSELAAAYYCGSSSEDGSHAFRLILLSGRTDENFELLSPGAKASLLLNAPVQNSGTLPEGYYGAGNGYGIAVGGTADSKEPGTSAASFVELKRFGDDEAQCYPVENGTVEVELESNGHYEIMAKFRAAGYQFEFEYEGPLDTYSYDVEGLDL